MERLLLAISTFLFLFAFGYTLVAFGAGRRLPHRFNFCVLLAAFVFQSWFLYLRGQEHGRCPLTSLFEVFVFLSWSVVLIYLLVGSSYRLSLMGAFTAPLAFLLQLVALLAPAPVRSRDLPPMNPWLEFHAAFSLIAYGAFGLACVSGAMYLVQERLLKSRRLTSVVFELPPISDLARANWRLLLLGFVLLTVGLGSGFGVGFLPGKLKLAGSAGVWLLYASVLAVQALGGQQPKWVAAFSVWGFGLSVAVLWGITNLATR